jgi:hypothetical protein
VGYITDLNRVGRRKIICLSLDSNPGRPPHTLIAILTHYGAALLVAVGPIPPHISLGYSKRRVNYSSLSNAEAKETLSSTPLIHLHDALPRFCFLREAVACICQTTAMAKNNFEIFMDLQVFNPRLGKSDFWDAACTYVCMQAHIEGYIRAIWPMAASRILIIISKLECRNSA